MAVDLWDGGREPPGYTSLGRKDGGRERSTSESALSRFLNQSFSNGGKRRHQSCSGGDLSGDSRPGLLPFFPRETRKSRFKKHS